MVKYTQTICWQQPTNCLSVFDNFVELVLKELNNSIIFRNTNHVNKEYNFLLILTYHYNSKIFPV